MSLVKIQNVMSNELGKRVFVTRPPEPPPEFLLNDPTDSIMIGITKQFGVPFTWTFAGLTNPHIAIVGISGSGKSVLVKTFLLRASYIWNTNAIIIDWAGEYKDWVNTSGGTVISLAQGDFLNIMDLSGMKPLDRAKQILTSFEILTDISDYPEQKRLTIEAIEQTYLNSGFQLAAIPDPKRESPTLKDVIALLEEKITEGTYEYPAELENAVYRLRQFAREGEDYFARKSTVDLGRLVSSGLVDLDLSALPDERFRALAALFVLQSLKEKMRMEGAKKVKGINAIVVLDEAWKIANDERSDAIMIVREGRKYNFGLIVASQNPTDINEAIFSNVGTTFMLKVKFERFMNYLQSSLNFSDFIRKEISKFGVGQSAVEMSFQTSVQFPETFVLESIIMELPLDAYTITIGDLLNQDELSDTTIKKEVTIEKIALNARFVEINVGVDVVNDIFKQLDAKNRLIDARGLAQIMSAKGVSRDASVAFFRGLQFSDTIITRVFMNVNV